MVEKRIGTAGRYKHAERVYVITCQQYSKIGRTRFIRKRLSNLRVDNPFPMTIALLLECPDAVALEARLHRYFKKQHHRGEWFDLPSELVSIKIRALIEDGKIDAREIDVARAVRKLPRPRPAPKVEPPVDAKTCLWCGEGFFSDNPKKVFCDNPNHRIYYSKKRRQQLELWWRWNLYCDGNYGVTQIEAMETFEIDTATAAIRSFGGFFNPETRQWEFPARASRLQTAVASLRALEPPLQTTVVQSAPTPDQDRVRTSGYGRPPRVPTNPLPQSQYPIAIWNWLEYVSYTERSSSGNLMSHIQPYSLRRASRNRRVDAHDQP